MLDLQDVDDMFACWDRFGPPPYLAICGYLGTGKKQPQMSGDLTGLEEFFGAPDA